MKVALVHDDLMQWGGAERVLHTLSEVFPDAPIYTSLYDETNKNLKSHFENKIVKTSFMQKIPGWKSLYRSLLPLYPIAFEQFDFSEYDLVISHTTRFAKSVITKPGTKHISLIHTPPRFLWNYSGVLPPKNLEVYLSFLRLYDRISSKRADEIIACSFNAAARVSKNYEISSKIIQPFVDTNKFNLERAFDGGYFLVISRLIAYKRVDILVRVFNKLGYKLKIVGNGPFLENLRKDAKPNIEFVGHVSEGTLKDVILGCKALIITAEEDFGLTALEAQAAGKPVIGYKKGGVLETVVENETGVLFESQDEESLERAIKKFEKMKFDPQKSYENALKFSKERFISKVKEHCKLMNYSAAS